MLRKSVVALAFLVLAVAFPEAWGHHSRHLRFAVSDNYADAPLPAAGEVDRSIELGMDELWIAYIHERCPSGVDACFPAPPAGGAGLARVREQLERAQTSPGFKVFFGLGAGLAIWENQYVDPYIDVAARYSPRRAPLGDFFGSTSFPNTGVDDAKHDVRSARVGRDPAGYLVAESYWRAGAQPILEPNPAPIAPRTYRFRFPLRGGANLGGLPPTAVVATIRIEEEDQGTVPPPVIRIVAERVVRAGDLTPAGTWHNIDVWANQALQYTRLYDPKIWWAGAADLSAPRSCRHSTRR